ncbi:uncharacterized protein LDX57_000002 [Aspergillus melleus]|uniref:uncharacterized protein n=1 Tax=Aspergillus melleus TaxID=138277 RepID=UPI001E8E67F0|nr:uncharacterized protein LDX57_000002 [Aspergillus melleus]KAH8422244.1 hypothetical protein LDX57_000002 [Aspergillus melleus]
MTLIFSVSTSGDFIVESSLKEVRRFLRDTVGAHYAFLEFVDNGNEREEYKLCTLAFHDQDHLFFVKGTFLVPFIQRGIGFVPEQVLHAVNCHASKLAELDSSARQEDFIHAHKALALTYYAMNYAAINWVKGRYDESRIRCEIEWLHIIDEIIDSLVNRHKNDFPEMEKALLKNHKEYLEMLKTEYGIATDRIPPKKFKLALFGEDQFQEAFEQYGSDDLAGS